MRQREAPPVGAVLSRRRFLQLGAGLGLSLGMLRLSGFAPCALAADDASDATPLRYDSWEDVYRNEWRWDRVSWGSHTNQCFPGGCSFHVYSRDGVVWREEQSASSEACSPEYPDFNPQGCQKGCGFHHALASPDRLLHPMRRVGARRRTLAADLVGRGADTSRRCILDAHATAGAQSLSSMRRTFTPDRSRLGIHRLRTCSAGSST